MAASAEKALKSLTAEEAAKHTPSKQLWAKLAKLYGRKAGTMRLLVGKLPETLAIPVGYRIILGNTYRYWSHEQIVGILKHFTKHPPAGSGRGKKGQS